MNLKLKENKIAIIGIFLIILSILLLVSNNLTNYIRPITSIFLMGSSKGKDIIFFGVFGSLLLLSPIFSNKLLENIEFFNSKNWTSKDFLKASLYLSVLTYLLAILLEIMLRLNFNVPIDTIFVSMDGTNINTTSILHSHLFKSIIGQIIVLIMNVPSDIHTGISLLEYTPVLSYLILLIVPLIYILDLFSINDRHPLIKILLSFSLTLNFIALFDGGIFSNPGLIGLFFTITILIWDINRKIKSIITPPMILLVIFSIEAIFSLTCGISTYYDVYIINHNNDIDNTIDTIVNLDKISTENNYLKLRINNSLDYTEMELMDSLIKKLNGKCDGFFITGNTMSYFRKDVNLNRIFN